MLKSYTKIISPKVVALVQGSVGITPLDLI